MNFATLKEKVISAKKKVKVAVVWPDGIEIFKAIKQAQTDGLCEFLLVGAEQTITAQAKAAGLINYEVLPAEEANQAAYLALESIHHNNADILMKGTISTSAFLKAVLDKEKGLRTKHLLSHLAILETEEHKFLGITDAGMNPEPTLADKVSIIDNAVDFFHRLGIEKPRVAILSATEKPNSNIPSSLTAAPLIEMVKKAGIKDCVVYGPIAFDIAISRRARQIKKVEDKIFSNADIILVPEIVCGNALAKALIFGAKFPSGGVVLGAQCPIILLSRADSAQEKLDSILLGITQCTPS
jgi:phosphate butyryltransferase